MASDFSFVLTNWAAGKREEKPRGEKGSRREQGRKEQLLFLQSVSFAHCRNTNIPNGAFFACVSDLRLRYEAVVVACQPRETFQLQNLITVHHGPVQGFDLLHELPSNVSELVMQHLSFVELASCRMVCAVGRRHVQHGFFCPLRFSFIGKKKKPVFSPSPLFFLATDNAIYARSAIGLEIVEANGDNVRSSDKRALQADTIRGQIPTGAR